MRNEMMKRVALALGLAVASSVALAENYTLGVPMPSPVNNTTDASKNAWLAASNNFIYGTGGYVFQTNSTHLAASGFSLTYGHVGLVYDASPYAYNLGDTLQPPVSASEIDWEATQSRYLATLKENGESELTGGLVFVLDGENSYVIAARGFVIVLDWVLKKDGKIEQATYNVAPYCTGRPKRIYWTDYPYNNQKVDLTGKFVRFFGSPNLVEPPKETVTNDVGGVFVEEKNKIVSGLYLNKDSMVLEARGEVEGQVVMVYYKDGNYTEIQHIQVIAVCRPETYTLTGVIGKPVKPNGRGYKVEGLKPIVQAGIGDVMDGLGDYLYQHQGQHSYSEHNGDVYPIRPTRGHSWKAEVCWMEEDAMKVYWPFEIDQYESDWMASATPYVRGDLDDPGASIAFPDAYTPTLMTYQEPFGHAKDISSDRVFTTDLRNTSTNVGYSLVKLIGSDDTLWFLTVKSILRSNTNYYTLAQQPAVVGQPLALDTVSRSALARGTSYAASPETTPYVYLPGTPARNYDVNLYSETNSASAVYPISTAGDIEVWWSTRVQDGVMPAPVDIPTLPTVFRPRWPETSEAPQIVLASQQGSAYETLYGHYGAATIDAVNSYLAMPSRTYFPNGVGTFTFWTRLPDLTDSAVTNGSATVMELRGENDRSLRVQLNRETQRMELVPNGDSKKTVQSDTMGGVSTDWQHFALVLSNGTVAISADEQVILSAGPQQLGDVTFLSRPLMPILGHSPGVKSDSTVVQPAAFVPSPAAVECGTWGEMRSQLQQGRSVRLTASVAPGAEDETTIVLPAKDSAYTNTLDLNSFDITGTAGTCLFTITNQATLVVGDSSAAANGHIYLNGGTCGYLAKGGAFDLRGGKISGGSARYGGCFYAEDGGNLVMNGGTVSDCRADVGGGMACVKTKATFTMNGGTIDSCSGPDTEVARPDGGGGVLLRGGTFTMNGGTISRCRSRAGGGVRLMPGNMVLNGGVIAECHATEFGGGVLVEGFDGGDSKMVMNGGRISGNTCEYSGGGVEVWTGGWGTTSYFTMNGGEISGNQSLNYGCIGLWAEAAVAKILGGTLDVEPTRANLAHGSAQLTVPAYTYDAGLGLYYIGIGTTVGRQIAEVIAYDRALTTNDLAVEKFKVREGTEAGLTGYWSFRPEEDLVSSVQTQGDDYRAFLDRTVDGRPALANAAHNVTLSLPGAPLKSSCVIVTDDSTEPTVYRQNDPSRPGYNPNEEHAFVQAGSGGYVAWALRCDLGLNGAPQGVFAEYVRGGKNRLQFYHVQATDETYPTLGGSCTAGLLLPGPSPLTRMDDPWLPEDYWEAIDGEGVYRDRKGQLWCRRGKTKFKVFMYYRNQSTFDWPTMTTPPEVGAAVPWLSLYENAGVDRSKPNAQKPHPWTWTAAWPENAPAMKIGQTVTTAEDKLAEVWNMRSAAVVYPAPEEGESVVMLSDPTVAQSVDMSQEEFEALGLKAEPKGGLTKRKGKYRFTEASPFVSERFYWDETNKKLCLIGELEQRKAGATILYPNVLSGAERQQLKGLVEEGKKGSWNATLDKLATAPVEPSRTEFVTKGGRKELVTTYKAVDHYALTALGGCTTENSAAPYHSTNYVVVIENDATDETMDFREGSATERQACPVSDGDPINMHVYRVVPEYHIGRAVTREDANNLLSQQLTVLYTDCFGGKGDDYLFKWYSREPPKDGHVPDPKTDGGWEPRPKPKPEWGESEDGCGLTRFIVGRQGDTLKSMVNTYWTLKYQAREGSPARAVMGEDESAWITPPALAEGWVQRCLNNVTPFTQRMTDLYNNKAETPVTMLQEAGGPYRGDVALNQDNLTSVGLIELYETLLNKAESMSIMNEEGTDAVSEQLLLAAERLGDLYKVLGDEAYSDAKNPTIGFGQQVDGSTKVPFGNEASSLFCFDNQVKTLLDEELALLRGRSGASAPTTQMAPYYNRLLWNFTRGITAGEVAYAVNYAVDGVDNDKVRLSEEEAAALYPQGHGDAYGHYLSALKGWYRLLRNPFFSWARAQGAMNLADTPANVDYYEEAKFATAAADLAKTAADVVDLTARAAWRDNGDGVTSPGYLDSNPTNAFGYGEWASRGGYGALCNWVVANSLLPIDQTLSRSSSDASSSSLATNYTDQGLMRIDRGNTDELAEICESAAAIMRAVDRIDCGLNPLGLSDNAIPFDIAPSGVADGSNTHFEQVRDRATTALGNARKVLERAQTQSSRMRMIQSAGENLAEQYEQEEAAYDEELISYYGTPYSDDIGPGKTYDQGYEGADLYHCKWMDFAALGLSDSTVQDINWQTANVSKSDIEDSSHFVAIVNYMKSKQPSENGTVASVDLVRTSLASSIGVLNKPASVTGSRLRPGKIQQKLSEFLLQYNAAKSAGSAAEKVWDSYHESYVRLSVLLGLETTFFAANEAMLIAKGVTTAQIAIFKDILQNKELKELIENEIANGFVESTPSVIGAGMTVVSSPRSIAQAAKAARSLLAAADLAQEAVLENSILAIETAMAETEIVVEGLKNAYDYEEKYHALYEELGNAAKEVSTAYSNYQTEITKLNVVLDECRTVLAEAEAILDKREAARKRQVNALSKLRYNEMFFRLMRDKTLSKYSAAFDLAQKYVFMAAQVYDYETGLKRKEDGSRDDFKAKIVATRSLGAFDSDGQPMVADDGDLGLSGYLAQMNANWLVLKPRLGINNPQQYTTWFSLRKELFRIYGTAAGDANWKAELKKYWVEDIQRHPVYLRHCQKFQSQFGLKDQEPGFVIPFSTTVDFAKNLFGNDLAGGDHAYDSTWYSTRIASAGVWFDGYNELTADAAKSAQGQLAANPTVYLIPTGYDCLRAPGQEDGRYWQFSVVDQVIPAPYAIGSYELDDETWYPSMADADWEGTDPTVKIRKHPMFRAYYGSEGAQPSDDRLDATRLIGRSVWNTEWYLIIPAGSMNADREKAMNAFLGGVDANRDGKLDVKPVTDIKIGFRTYSQSGN